ncbi:MAG: hypothetical protein MJ137_08275 [Clostridia bacterium]|nr:hypothetical protein [Clostridia bacterium]
MTRQDKKGTDVRKAFSDILSSLTVYFAILAVAVILIISLSGIRIVKSGEVALVFRFGKLVGNTYEEQVHEPGLLFAFPYVIDEVVTVPTGTVKKLEVITHYTPTHMSGFAHNGYVISGDRNLVLVKASVQCVISDPVAYTTRLSDEEGFMRGSISGAMIDAAAVFSADELLTSGKTEYAALITENSQKLIDAAGVGLSIRSVELTDVSMPFEVRDVYDYVGSAKVTASTKLEQAAQYRETVIPQAEAKAHSLISEATSAAAADKAAANGALSEFYGILDEFSRSPEAVKTRIYHEKLAELLRKVGTIKIVDKDSDSKIIINGG